MNADEREIALSMARSHYFGSNVNLFSQVITTSMNCNQRLKIMSAMKKSTDIGTHPHIFSDPEWRLIIFNECRLFCVTIFVLSGLHS